MNLTIKEWGDKMKDGQPGFAEYTGDADKTKDYFAKIGLIGYLHEPGDFIEIRPCKTTYEKTKDRIGGPLLNIFNGKDTTGISSKVGLPTSEPKTGDITVVLPIRYNVKIGGQAVADSEANVTGATSIKEVQKQGTKYIITIRKTDLTSKSVSSDAPTRTWTPVIPPVLP
jgi:hypothetical protein